MGLIDKFAARLGFARQHVVVRRFDGAAINRLSAGWIGSVQSIDEELKGDLDRLRARSRDLANNNDYVRKFIKMVQTNVVGPNGFSLQCAVEDSPSKPDDLANKAIESSYDKWSRPANCDIRGRQDFPELCRALIGDVARDGEALAYRVRGKASGNAWGYALQRLDVARIATSHVRAASAQSNAISMGVELTAAGKPVAVWLYKTNPGAASGSKELERIPMDDIFHLFIGERPEQTRGYPWLHTAMQRLHQLKGYEEAAVIAARVGAAKMGFFTSPDGTGSAIGEKDANTGEFVTSADAGEFQVLPQGYEFQAFNPDYPHQQFGDFVKATLRGIASGLNISYNTLANDLEGVNFSSIRSGVLEEREQWMTLQRWFIQSFMIPVFEEWLQMSLMSGAISLPNGSPLPAVKLDKFNAHTWQGRRWPWVDPVKDIEASVIAIENGLASPYTIASNMGVDIDDVLDGIARFQAAAEAKGVKLGKSTPKPDTPPPPADLSADANKQLDVLRAELRTQRELPIPVQVHTPVTITISAEEMRGAAQELRAELAEQGREMLQQIREDVSAMNINVAAPIVHVAAPSVTVENHIDPTPVTLEATLPAPTITLPARRTETTVRYNDKGEITATTQIEMDA